MECLARRCMSISKKTHFGYLLRLRPLRVLSFSGAVVLAVLVTAGMRTRIGLWSCEAFRLTGRLSGRRCCVRVCSLGRGPGREFLLETDAFFGSARTDRRSPSLPSDMLCLKEIYQHTNQSEGNTKKNYSICGTMVCNVANIVAECVR